MQRFASLVPTAAAIVLATAILLGQFAFGSSVLGQEPVSEDPTHADDLERSKDPDDDEPAMAIRDQIVVSANRQADPADTVGSSVTVIDAAEIARRRQPTVLELLRTVPGVEITRTGGPGKAASVRIRGGDASQTLVLIDGVRANSPTTGDFDFAGLMVDNIERIEILRGPQATYGSEAVTGVISIMSKRGGQGFAFDGLVEAGSQDFRHLRLAMNGGNERVDYSVSLSDLSTDGVSHTSERQGNTEVDPFQNQTVAGRVGVGFAGDGRVDLTVRYFEGRTDLDGFFGDDLNASQRRESVQTAVSVKKQFGRLWHQTFVVSTYRDDLLGEDPDTPFGNFQIDTETSELYSQSDVRLAETDTLTLGYSAERREASNVGTFTETVDIRSAFLQNQWSWRERLYLTGAVRNDDHEQFGDETTWRLTGAFLLTDAGTRLHGTIGTAFRAPDFNELYFPFAGDPELRPETNQGIDIGVEQSLLDGSLVFDVTWFENDFDDLIAFDLVTFSFKNINQASSDGVELSVDADVSESLGFRFMYTYNDTVDLATGEALARRPLHKSSLIFDFEPLERLRGTATFLVVSDRIDSDGRDMDDYQTVDLVLDYRLTGRIRSFLRIDNLFDEDYEEVTGFTTPGIRASVGLQAGF